MICTSLNIRCLVIFILSLLTFCTSCVGPKFTYNQEGFSNIKFSQGKWILNRPVVYGIDDELYDRSLKKWKGLIGDSLFLLKEDRKSVV